MTKKMLQQQPAWWKEGVVYQIYPASFKDSNDDGIGDIPGIISKLDYVKELGVDIIWVSPHYKSPQVDMGYDISDFEDVHEPYGTLGDCEDLIREVHARGMRIIFDLVINHTSDQHPWFVESRSSKTNPKRDWYFWRPPKFDEHGNRTRPNNWRSQFTKPAWTWDEATQEYYLHVYASGQPDLNWENEDCRQALYETSIKFWLDRGVDGFRVDTVNKYSKVAGLPDAPVLEPEEDTQIAVCHYANGPRIHEYLREMQSVLSNYDVMTVGELPNTPDIADVMAYISPSAGELNMVFNFDTVNLGQTPGNRFLLLPFDNTDFKQNLTKWQTLPETSGAWPTVFLENHDQGRSISRFASDLPQHREVAAKMLATLLSTMTGTLFLYQGQEIGMINAPISWSADQYKCVRSVNYYNDICQRSANDPTSLERARANLQRVARDHARVPMQWNGTRNAGFCGADASPWMTILESHVEINVADQVGRPGSSLEYWRYILRLRKSYARLFVYGNFKLIEQHPDLFMFVKTDKTTGQRALTVANLSRARVPFKEPPCFPFAHAVLLIQNCPLNLSAVEKLSLRPYEARVYYLKQADLAPLKTGVGQSW
ncbi:hypothetical protein ACHAQA_005362 [Verticillium albo-atrum]